MMIPLSLCSVPATSTVGVGQQTPFSKAIRAAGNQSCRCSPLSLRRVSSFGAAVSRVSLMGHSLFSSSESEVCKRDASTAVVRSRVARGGLMHSGADVASSSPISHPTQSGASTKGGISHEVSMSVFLSEAQQSTQPLVTVNSRDISCRQREIPALQQVSPPRLLPESDMRLCRTFRDALGLCIQRSRVRHAQRDLASHAGIHPTQFSKILHGAKGQDWNLPGDAIQRIESACGNLAMTQFLASQHGGRIVLETPEERRIRELEEEVARLRERAA